MRAESLARRLATGPASALTEIKSLLRSSLDRELAGQVAAETEGLQRCARTSDYAEGLSAILERRPPRFGQEGPPAE
jgi:2-(1,2-epoxy-1,2-dihydrophenyl)acetyl-CoA isomerase